MNRITRILAGAVVGVVLLAGAASAQTARADMVSDTGAKVGTAELEQTPHGVLITLNVRGLPPGPHAFHIHSVGVCEPPFTSAGGHFNPAAKQHGIRNPAGMHAGDFPNIEVPASGATRAEVLAGGVTIGPGPATLFDADGSSLVIHAGPDDYRTDPAGNAGGRIACGVVTR
ncbi:superoxide dismutase family protein [Candidatus Binatia bacterium]|nr:superoxide dismutase family protein [Candidatus Binatia bacterium]